MSTDLYQALETAPQPGQPLVFAFHGTGGDEAQLFTLAGHLLPGAGIVSPRGDVSEHGAARFFRRNGEGVYDMEDLARASTKMIAYVEAHRAEHPDSPTYGFGYSNGANILAAVVLKRPDLFERVGLLHPLIPWQPAPQPGLAGRSVLITGGRQDPISPVEKTGQLMDWCEANGAEVTAHIHDGGHELQKTELSALQTLLRG